MNRIIRSTRVNPLPFVLALASALLAGCANNSPPAAQMDQVTTLSTGGFLEDWNTRIPVIGSESATNLYVLGDTIHVITNQNDDIAFTRSSGDLKYDNQIVAPPQSIVGGPVIAGDPSDPYTVFASTVSVEVFNQTGTRIRSIDLDATVTGNLSSYKDLVFLGVAANGGRIDAVDVTKDVGAVIWQVMTFGPVSGAAAIEGEVIYAGSEDGSVRAFYDDRTLAWPVLPDDRFMTAGRIVGDVSADKELTDKSGVYFASSDSQVYCVSPTDGRLKWKYFAGRELNSGPIDTATTIFQLVPGVGLAAIDKHLSQTLDTPDQTVIDEAEIHPARWIAPNIAQFLSVDKKYAYVLTRSREIEALDLHTGQLAYKSHRRDLAVFATNLDGSEIYACTRGGELLAIKPGATGDSGVLVLNDARPLKPIN
ncbi:MAG: PQQ-binding-like beta-propeller repeat protein [Tepidisphaeraceae bacterium]